MRHLQKSLLASLIFLFPIALMSDNLPGQYSSFDASGAVGMGKYSGAVSGNHTQAVGGDNNFRFGLGIRYSVFSGSDLTYETAPQHKIDEIDEFVVENPINHGLNLFLEAEYGFNEDWGAGFNIDLMGLGFGPRRTGKFLTDEDGHPSEVAASPTSFNLLIMGPMDRGQLKSEFYAAYTVDEQIRVRGGADMSFAEYTTDQVLTNDNDRFRHIAMMMFGGASYNPFDDDPFKYD